MNIGDKIPEILGIDQDGNEIKSSDFRGRKIILYSYPKANTSGCTAEACSLQSHKQERGWRCCFHNFQTSSSSSETMR